MRRKLFTLAERVSGVLCATAAIALIASCFWHLRVGRLTEGRNPDGSEDGRTFRGLIIGSGSLSGGDWGWWHMRPTGAQFQSRPAPPPPTISSRWYADAESRTPHTMYPVGNPVWPGFVRDGIFLSMTAEIRHFLSVPLWLVVVLTAIAPARRLKRRYGRSDRQRARGLCPRCGYDLRATPDRCPECGAVAVGLKSCG